MNDHVAVHAHFYYLELAPKLFQCIDNIVSVVGRGNVRIYATYPETAVALGEAVRNNIPMAEMIGVPNRGYDIGPFFEVLKRIDFSWADYVVKIHTKRDVDGWVNFRMFKGAAWRNALLGFCCTPKAFQRVLKSFRQEPNLGMIADRRLIDPSGVGSGRHPEYCERLLQEVGLSPKGRTIVYGTMFVARAQLLRVFSAFSIDQCDEVTSRDAHIISGLANASEGAFSMAIEAQGFRVAQGVFPRLLSLLYYKLKKHLFGVLRLLSDAIRGL